MDSNNGILAVFGGILGLVFAAAWITHVIHTINAEEWIFLVAGALFVPIAIVHGIGLWFGAF